VTDSKGAGKFCNIQPSPDLKHRFLKSSQPTLDIFTNKQTKLDGSPSQHFHLHNNLN